MTRRFFLLLISENVFAMVIRKALQQGKGVDQFG